MTELSERLRRQVVATRGYLVENGISEHFADILLSHYLDFAREIEAEPPPSYDGSKSLGERLCEAFAATFEGGGWADAPVWANFDARGQARYERAALNFTARLSDRGEGLGERPEPARERRGDPSPALPADDWVEWKGGENPAPGKVVDVKYRNGVADNYVNSTEVDWPHASSVIGITGYDIIAYRILPSTPSDTGKASG